MVRDFWDTLYILLDSLVNPVPISILTHIFFLPKAVFYGACYDSTGSLYVSWIWI